MTGAVVWDGLTKAEINNAHALLSPSGAAGWMVCAGKPAMERGLPDDSNEHSDYGTCAHTVASWCLTEDKDPAAYLGRRIDVGHYKTVEVDQEMVDGVRIYVEMVHKRVADYKLPGAVSVEMMVEQRVPIGHITMEYDWWLKGQRITVKDGEDPPEGAEEIPSAGTADVVIIVLWADGTALIDVIDLKFGVGVKVFAENNPQGMFYALGAVEKFSVVTDFDRVRICTHQPRVSEEPSDWEIGIDELMAFSKHATARAAEATFVLSLEGPEKQDQWLVPGDHCRKTFCKARATCPKLAQFVQDSVGCDFGEIVDVSRISEASKTLLVKELTSETQDIATKFKAIDIIEDWCKAVRARAEGLLFERGNSPETIAELGIKLVQGKQGNRAWKSIAEAEAAMKSMRLKQDQMYEFSLISPTTAESLAPKFDKEGNIKPGQTDTPLKPKQWAKLQTLITRSPGKPSVADASDKRPALEIKPVADDFDVVVSGVGDLV